MPDGILKQMVTIFPGWDAIAASPRVTIIDQVPPATIQGEGTGRVVLICETTRGELNKCVKVADAGEIVSLFGDRDWSISTVPEFTAVGTLPSKGWEGNAWWFMEQRKFAELCIARADVALRDDAGDKVAFTLTRGGTTTSAYTLPAGTILEGTNDDADDVQLALMSDVTFAANATTATAYARPISADICGEDFSVGAYGAIVDVLTATVNGTVYPVTTTQPNGDLSYPYPSGQTMGADAVSHSAFTADSWADIVNVAYRDAIGNSSYKGGAYSSNSAAAGRDIICSARHWAGTASQDDCSTIHTAMASHVSDSQAVGVFALALLRPPLACDKESAEDSSAPGVATNRSDRIIYCYPGATARISGFDTQTDLETGWDSWMASILSQLPAVEDPSQYHKLIKGCGITGIMQIKATASSELRDLVDDDYVDFQAAGICAPSYSSTYGWTCMSGITSSLTSGREPIDRRRMADYIDKAIAVFVESAKSQKVRTKVVEAMDSAINAFFEGLKSEEDPDAQWIDDYTYDLESGNTTTTEAAKIYVIKWKVKLLPSMNSFALFSEISDTVVIAA